MSQKYSQATNLVLVALGANLPSSAGSPDESLRISAARIAQLPGVTVTAISRFWRTPAHPAGSGPDYVNAAMALRSAREAQELLEEFHRIEADLGRSRDGGRWASRGIDIDLLAVGDQVHPDDATQDRWRALPPEEQTRIAPEQLILPHPRLQDRGFVLGPLAEIAPDWLHPRLGLSVLAMRDQLPEGAFAGMLPECP